MVSGKGIVDCYFVETFLHVGCLLPSLLCHPCAGVQILADDLSGFGRLSVSLLTDLADEFPNRSLMYYSVRPPSVQSLAGSSNAVERCT